MDPYCLIDESCIVEIWKLRSLKNILGKYNVPIRTIFDLGARDLYESIWMSKHFEGSEVHSFECNPDVTKLCRERSYFFNNIIFNEVAISSKGAPITFYKVDKEATKSKPDLPYFIAKDGNPGASSIYKSLDETYVQVPIEVQSIRLDSYLEKNQIYNIDLLWMDIQGAELDAMISLGNRINNVKFIHLEMPLGSNTPYEGAPAYEEIHEFLNSCDFKMIARGEMDFIYVNTKVL